MALQADGGIMLGGRFAAINGIARSLMARLNAAAALDLEFSPTILGLSGCNPCTIPFVNSLALQANGKAVLGGYFSTIDGLSRSSIARLDSKGTVDLSFFPRVRLGNVTPVAIQTDRSLLAGGTFDAPGGAQRRYLAQFDLLEQGTNSLNYGEGAIVWHRGGTAPEVHWTTFEHSLDYTNWTTLGAGTRVAGGWELTGVPLPKAGTLRARGFINSSQSSWFVESLLALADPIHLNVVRDGTEVVLTWTGGAGLFQVQQSIDLSQSNSWWNLGAAKNTNMVRVSAPTNALFLRVRGQ